jgi:hypothetical protein
MSSNTATTNTNRDQRESTNKGRLVAVIGDEVLDLLINLDRNLYNDYSNKIFRIRLLELCYQVLVK